MLVTFRSVRDVLSRMRRPVQNVFDPIGFINEFNEISLMTLTRNPRERRPFTHTHAKILARTSVQIETDDNNNS